MASTSTNAIRQLNIKLNSSLTRAIAISRQSGRFHTSARCMFTSNSNEKAPSNEASTDSTSSPTPMQGGIWRDPLARDPTLPPKPPPGTYPHPYPQARDDPHSDSMRTHYQAPVTGTGSRAGAIPTSRSTVELNRLGNIPRIPVSIELPKVYTPLYVIHVKSTPNNTLVSFHAPTTPKLPTTTGGGKSKSSAKSTPVRDRPFSIGANPDEPRQDDISADVGTGVGTTTLTPEVVSLAPNPTVNESTNRCIGWASGGSCHYKKVNRSTYEAGYDAAVRITRRIEETFEYVASGGVIEDLPPMQDLKRAKADRRPATIPSTSRGIMRIRVTYSGFGVGREAFNAAILSAEGSAVRGLIGQLQDRTPIKIGGCRGRKVRRV